MNIMNKSKRGGKRAGAGRKPVKIKKEAVYLYIPTPEIVALGGKESVKIIAEQYVSNRAKKCG